MFFFLPLGHDHPVYDRPWLTFSLMATCTLVFLLSWGVEEAVIGDLEYAFLEVEAVSLQYPEARLPYALEGAPPAVDDLMRPYVDLSPERVPAAGDAQLEAAVGRLVAAINQLPTLRFGYRPGHPTVQGVVGHTFMHGGLFHLLGNMLFLFVAGGVLECFWRKWAYLLLYFGTAFAGTAAHHLADPDSLTPVIGASGAVAGLIGAFVVCHPKTRIRIGWFFLFFFRPYYGSWWIKAWIVIPLWAGSELVHALFSANDGVAYWAHVGGFFGGVAVGLVSRKMGWVATDAGREIASMRAAKSETLESAQPTLAQPTAAALSLPSRPPMSRPPMGSQPPPAQRGTTPAGSLGPPLSPGSLRPRPLAPHQPTVRRAPPPAAPADLPLPDFDDD
ncbi:MAG: rhomboid family intramembrane serine protease [Sandaracinaceae bacterium]